MISPQPILNNIMHPKYQTGSHHLHRKPFFNQRLGQMDIDVPDGDVEVGKRVFDVFCAGCHKLYENTHFYPKLHNIFGKTAGSQKGFKSYSYGIRSIGYQWSRQRLYYLIENPEQVLGILSNMDFNGLEDRYLRACVIEYLHYQRIHTSDLVKPEWINKKFI